ncbi:GNAT family N-acetyltransferase [Colwellia sp. 12G3]|uniref:GNAT family N-acetyltransferase n=1 Tax=Colwellia sp. 12G3 TaxID=2058299 RepID=UPI000C337CD1|nr:GNAT family N-acetyltransferase [Colwellia sp. 12G3]PKI12935.1 hypothetical protein CXF71_19700 [Colwellia sp. 12G3]
MTNSSLILCPVLAKKSDKKSILRFYKDNHYSARFIGYDTCYLIKKNDKIIASVILSLGENRPEISQIGEDILLTKSRAKPQYLLHALFVTPDYRKLGYAESLLKHSITHHQQLVCFAQTSLNKLYLNNGFTLLFDDLMSECLTPTLLNRFKQYSKHKTELKVYIHQISK